MRRYVARTLILAVALLVTAFSLAPQISAEEIDPAPQETAIPNGPTEVDRRYEAYGFLFEQYDQHERYGRFSEGQMEGLAQVILAYADLVGGSERLARLVNGPVRVRKDGQAAVSYTQAGKVIGLGRGAFDLALTVEHNFYTWGAEDADELAQIVFGHEIAHRWIETLRRQNGRDWTDAYGQTVWRGEDASSTARWGRVGEPEGEQVAPEEEAVTNLALYALDRGYRWTFLYDAPATAGRQLHIDRWVSDLANG